MRKNEKYLPLSAADSGMRQWSGAESNLLADRRLSRSSGSIVRGWQHAFSNRAFTRRRSTRGFAKWLAPARDTGHRSSRENDSANHIAAWGIPGIGVLKRWPDALRFGRQ